LLEKTHTNQDVIKYTEIIFDKTKHLNDFYIDLTSGHSFKLRNLHVICQKSNTDYGKTKFTEELTDFFLDNCVITITYSNLIELESTINHELNHILEFYLSLFNKSKLNKSWNLNKKLNNHKKLANNFEIWDDFTYLIYLTLKHELNSHISEIYHRFLNDETPLKSLKKDKFYIKCLFYLNIFDFDNFYKLFIKRYTEKDFLNLTINFFQNFNFDTPKDLKSSKDIIRNIIDKLKKKLYRYKSKSEKVVKRIEKNRLNINKITETEDNRNLNINEEYLILDKNRKRREKYIKLNE